MLGPGEMADVRVVNDEEGIVKIDEVAGEGPQINQAAEHAGSHGGDGN
jgi:hypothetical protein